MRCAAGWRISLTMRPLDNVPLAIETAAAGCLPGREACMMAEIHWSIWRVMTAPERKAAAVFVTRRRSRSTDKAANLPTSAAERLARYRVRPQA